MEADENEHGNSPTQFATVSRCLLLRSDTKCCCTSFDTQMFDASNAQVQREDHFDGVKGRGNNSLFVLCV